MVVSGCDKDSLSQSKDALSAQLTQKVQADTNNANSQVTVNEVRVLSDDTLALDYECHDVADQNTAKNSINNAAKGTDIQKTIDKSAKSHKSTTTTAKQQATTQTSTFFFLLLNIFISIEVSLHFSFYRQTIS